MKVPKYIIKLIKQIENMQSSLSQSYRVLYEWLDKHEIDTTEGDGYADSDIIANLQDGVGAEEFIKWLEQYKK